MRTLMTSISLSWYGKEASYKKYSDDDTEAGQHLFNHLTEESIRYPGSRIVAWQIMQADLGGRYTSPPNCNLDVGNYLIFCTDVGKAVKQMMLSRR